MNIARTDQSLFGRWWWTVDRPTVLAIGVLTGFGLVLTLAASPAVAERIHTDTDYFIKHQLFLTPFAMALLFGVSLQSPRIVRRIALAGLLVGIVALVMTFVVGAEIKGARRWLSVLGISVQPSEFVKPCFAVVCGWLLAQSKEPGSPLPGNTLATALFVLILGLLVLQPDLGQAIVLIAIFLAECFLAGLPIILAIVCIGLVVAAGFGAYWVFPHVHSRVDHFLHPEGGVGYQVMRSLEAFANGGLLGKGPGEGTVKQFLPDAHADTVLAVAGEEFGLVTCLVIVALFAFIVLRGFSRLMEERSLYVVLAGAGLLVQFGLQAIINMASTLHLMPTKGMTLPFLSYGGSSLIALGLGMGMLLALTRRRFGTTEAT
jgi:cell division protein FtsW